MGAVGIGCVRAGQMLRMSSVRNRSRLGVADNRMEQMEG